MLDPAALRELGRFEYRPDKDLVLHAVLLDRIDTSQCVCTSVFRDRWGRLAPGDGRFPLDSVRPGAGSLREEHGAGSDAPAFPSGRPRRPPRGSLILRAPLSNARSTCRHRPCTPTSPPSPASRSSSSSSPLSSPASRSSITTRLRVALIGLAAITLYKIAFSGFNGGAGVAGLVAHLGKEWVTGDQPVLLLIGLRAARAPLRGEPRCRSCCRACLPDDWKGGFAMLVVVFVLSSFLDNIAAAMIGGTMATASSTRRVHVGYPRRDRRRVERRRLGQRRRRHDDDDDVDRRRRAARRSSRPTSRPVAGAAVLRRRRRAPAARLPADHEGRAGRDHARQGRGSASSPRSCAAAIAANVSLSSSSRRWLDAAAGDRPGGVGDVAAVARRSRAARLERAAAATRGQRLPLSLVLCGVDDAGRGAAGGVLARPRSASASSRRCSTTSR